ncbi:glycoside hydrolase family 2 TIM barrel-domain containing protein [uncultured Lutibacter sp.]|uniref:glycoside hydrolase family 2 TIM barrel-domain containing protein n=1 Tax=uncultured Lutibacter sp. TaxID=437739 RepID=UPI002634F9E5|nr:glycoside hydrolase family 2 TIM barrel-domain containing protein [uncultured Lutibacter sp.]
MKNIKLIQFVIIAFFSINLIGQNTIDVQTRKKENFNKNWKFKLDEKATYSASDFDDTNWRELNLPHDWSVEAEFSENNSGRNAWLPGGIGWYRKSFSLAEIDKNKHIEIQFDGVYRHSQIWVNGKHVGIQYDGYTSFYFDITPFVHFDKENVIVVKVDNSVQPNCRWYSGSGIYRNVWLTVTDPLHVKNWGTYITTPQVLKEKAVVNIKTTLENFRKLPSNAIISTEIFNSEGKKITSNSTEIKADLLKDYEINQNLEINAPKLWSVASPTMYTAITNVVVDGNVVDDYKSTFGIRTIQFDAEKGFFLNGENMKMKGVCLHHDAGVLGAAVPIEVWQRRLKTLKEMGCNAIRTAHNPTAPEFMDLCDEMGFLVMDEFVDKWTNHGDSYMKKNDPNNFFNPQGFADPYFEMEWEKNYSETVKRDRNHPSVIIWSVGNENHSPGSIQQNVGLKKYTSFVRSLDPTRPVISGMERGKDDNPHEKVSDIIESCLYMDLIALNYGEQWCKEIGKRKPGKPYVSTESYVYFNSSPEKRFPNIERSPWLDVLDSEHNMGLFLWAGIDYLGESKNFPRLGTDCALMDMAGFRKERSYLYEAFWSDKPMVRIAVYEGDADDFSTSGRWGTPPMNENWNLEKGKTYDLVTYTNCESVNLYLNGKKIGNKKLADFSNFIMKWRKIKYQPGILKAKGVIEGKEVCEFKLKTSGKAHRIDIEVGNEEVSKDGVVQFEVNIVDRQGNLVYDSSLLNFKIEGGKILGLSNGNMDDLTSFNNKIERKVSKGRLLVIAKANSNTNTLKLSVQSEKLKQKSYLIEVK